MAAASPVARSPRSSTGPAVTSSWPADGLRGVPRRLGDRDIVWWLVESGYLDASVGSLPGPAARLSANVQATGHGGGQDLHYRTLRKVGVTLLGHFLGADGRRARFAPDLDESVAWGDERNGVLMNLVRKLAAERGLPAPEIPEPEPFNTDALEELDLSGFGAVVFARLLAGDSVEVALRHAATLAARNAGFRGASGLSRHLRGELVTL